MDTCSPPEDGSYTRTQTSFVRKAYYPAASFKKLFPLSNEGQQIVFVIMKISVF